MSADTRNPVEIDESDLDGAQGGLIGLLLPAVQKVREAAAGPSSGGGPHVKVFNGTSGGNL